MTTAVSQASELAAQFLTSKRVSGCSTRTLQVYQWWLNVLLRETAGQLTPLTVQAFFARLRERNLSASTIHQAYRTTKTYFRWCLSVGALTENPLRGFAVRTPRTLPTVPTDAELRAVVGACSDDTLGLRNRALVLVMADAGLRASEVLHLLVEDWKPSDRSLFVRSGKGAKDRTVFVTPTTARAIREYLSTRRILASEDYLFTTDDGQPLHVRHLVQTLHRLSKRAGIEITRRLHPHALRHYAATSWLRNGMGLEEVRRLLGHSTLSTTLRYSNLVSADVAAAHKKAGALERLHLTEPRPIRVRGGSR